MLPQHVSFFIQNAREMSIRGYACSMSCALYRGSRRNSRQFSRQPSDAFGRGLNTQDSYGMSQPSHSRQTSMDAGPRVSFSRQESLDIPAMSQPGKVAYGENTLLSPLPSNLLLLFPSCLHCWTIRLKSKAWTARGSSSINCQI